MINSYNCSVVMVSKCAGYATMYSYELSNAKITKDGIYARYKFQYHGYGEGLFPWEHVNSGFYIVDLRFDY